jgi:cyanophycinase-like exopeptidase
MLKKGYKYGLGIDENTAMVVDPPPRGNRRQQGRCWST